MSSIFSIETTLVEILGYQLSPLEAFATLSLFFGVWLAARNNIHTWTASILSAIAFFFLFFQVQLYSDMVLQIFFIIMSIIGLVTWRYRGEQTLQISLINANEKGIGFLFITVGAFFLSYWTSQAHLLWPEIFVKPVAYPVADAFTTTMSIVATVLLIRRKLEAWILWVLVDAISVFLYFKQGIWITGIEYAILFCFAVYGFISWKKESVYV